MYRRRVHRSAGGVSFRIGAVIRIAGLVVLLLAVAAAAADLRPLLDGDPVRMAAAGELWFRLDAASLNALQAFIQRYLHPAVWDPVLVRALLAPAWVVIAVPGLLLYLLGRWLGRR